MDFFPKLVFSQAPAIKFSALIEISLSSIASQRKKKGLFNPPDISDTDSEATQFIFINVLKNFPRAWTFYSDVDAAAPV